LSCSTADLVTARAFSMSKRDRDRDMNRDGHRDGGTDATKPWKQTLALLHSKRELHTPEKERQASESSTKVSAPVQPPTPTSSNHFPVCLHVCLTCMCMNLSHIEPC
jgi:hypothetical protein